MSSRVYAKVSLFLSHTAAQDFHVDPIPPQINRYVMLTIFFLPLCMIALYEAQLDPAKNHWIKDWFSSPDEGGEDAPHYQDPEVTGADAARGLKISKKQFKDIIAAFPDTTHVSAAFLWWLQGAF